MWENLKLNKLFIIRKSIKLKSKKHIKETILLLYILMFTPNIFLKSLFKREEKTDIGKYKKMDSI